MKPRRTATTATATPSLAIEVRNARTHNLRGVDCRVPHGRITVITGPSGAGKSSLAFDTIFAEGQRRFVESMSTYARQFLDQMERPPVDSIDHVLPAVALEAKNSIRNARSTVGTVTETHDVLRLLFTHLGVVHCPHGHGPGRRFTADEAARDLLGGSSGPEFTLAVQLPRPRRDADAALRELVRQGFSRARQSDGSIERLAAQARWPAARDPLTLVLGRFRATEGASADEDLVERLASTLVEGFRLAAGRVLAYGFQEAAAPRIISRDLACTVCGESLRAPVPPLFSFHSPLGACSSCQGFGRIVGIDPDRVVPDAGKSLSQRPIAPWNTPAYEELYDGLYRAARRRRVPLDVPWRDLPEEARRWVWSGAASGRKTGKADKEFVALDGFFRWLEARTYKVHVRVMLARYRAYTRCPACDGARLRPEALAVLVAGRTLPELTAMSVEELRDWFSRQTFAEYDPALAGPLREEVEQRLDVLHRVGLDYLTLDRQARTLSGGEAQRIHLAAALGSGLTSTLYVLDEPTIGLHPQDSERLLGLLRDLSARGNTVLVVEHDRTLILGADHLIDLGPRAGEHGGRVMAEGPPEVVLRHPESLTAQFLRERPATEARRHLDRFRREHGRASFRDELTGRPRVRVRGARANNLRGFDVEFPLQSLVVVTGVSGSGKSTLVENVLYGTYQRSRGVVDVEPGECDALEGLEQVLDVELVDQRPIGRSSRSNPVTFVKAYDEIRRLFAADPRARALGIGASHFSFNLERGRCPVCQGTGVVEVDMQFMAAVTVTCDTCQGRRFKPEVLAVRVGGRTIAETLELTIDEALVEFAEQKRLCRRLEPLREAGLGYLRLGQPTATLSGGEAQRLKLASFLASTGKDTERLFLFDEPTTGLHLSDVDLLYRTLRRLMQAGGSVLVVEHNLDLIVRADWIVDLGPGGGSHGGALLFSGPLDEFLDQAQSPTAEELRRHTRWRIGKPVARAGDIRLAPPPGAPPRG